MKRKNTPIDPRQMLPFATTEIVRTGTDTWRVVTGSPVAMLRVKQVARELSVAKRTVYSWIENGVINSGDWEKHGPKCIFVRASVLPKLRNMGEK